MPKNRRYKRKEPITVKPGEDIVKALERRGDINPKIEVDKKTAKEFKKGTLEPSFDTLTRIARATKTGGGKHLTEKDYKRARKEYKKLMKKNKKVKRYS